jgi:hypothetical protein
MGLGAGRSAGMAATYDAEASVTQLQGDALVTLDADLRRSGEGIVETASPRSLGPKRLCARCPSSRRTRRCAPSTS